MTTTQTLDPKEHLNVAAQMALLAGFTWANMAQDVRVACADHVGGVDGLATLATEWAEEFLATDAAADMDGFRVKMIEFTNEKLAKLRTAAQS